MKPECSASETDAYGCALLEVLEQRSKFGYRIEIIQKFMIKKAEPEERLAFAKRLYQEKLLIENNHSFIRVFFWNTLE